jgi:hypothetical protein
MEVALAVPDDAGDNRSVVRDAVPADQRAIILIS